MPIKIETKKIPSFDELKLWVKTYQNAPDWRIRRKIVFVHGVANNVEIWEPIINEILANSPRVKCIAYDLRGHGRSTKKFSHLSRMRLEEIHALDLEILLKQMAPWRPVLVGHSLGGIIIQEFYNLSPKPWQKPRLTFLLATNTKTKKIKQLNRKKVLEKLTKLAKYEGKEIKVPKIDDYLERQEGGDFSWKSIQQTLTNLPVHGSLLHWGGLLNWENRTPEKINSSKVTLIYGGKDQIFPAKEVESSLAELPKVNRIRVDEAKHGLSISEYQFVAQEIVEKL